MLKDILFLFIYQLANLPKCVSSQQTLLGTPADSSGNRFRKYTYKLNRPDINNFLTQLSLSFPKNHILYTSSPIEYLSQIELYPTENYKIKKKSAKKGNKR